jgi:hypothetical protein
MHAAHKTSGTTFSELNQEGRDFKGNKINDNQNRVQQNKEKNKMKSTLTIAVMAGALGLAAQANAGWFDFTEADGNGNVTATAWVNTDDGIATAGTLTITGGEDNGVWSLVDLSSLAAAQGVNLSQAPNTAVYVTVPNPANGDNLLVDNWFYVNAGLQMDPYGLLFERNGVLLDLSSMYEPGYTGNVNASGEYGIYDGVSIGGSGTCGVPDGGMTASLLGTGLIGLAMFRRKLAA